MSDNIVTAKQTRTRAKSYFSINAFVLKLCWEMKLRNTLCLKTLAIVVTVNPYNKKIIIKKKAWCFNIPTRVIQTGLNCRILSFSGAEVKLVCGENGREK